MEGAPVVSSLAAASASAPLALASSSSAAGVDLVVTLGGDGLLMYVNTVFPRAAPPILSLAAGSLGFLAPFEVRRERGTFILAPPDPNHHGTF
jgi:NAD kinase